MARRTRIDTVAGSLPVMAAANRDIQPPSNVPLTKTELPFFVSIIGELPKADWTAHQLETAALLSRAMATLASEQRSLQTEGTIIQNRFGEPKANPREGICAKLMAQIVSMRRSLALHARAMQGEPRDIAKRRSIGKDIEASSPFDNDDLLARPN